MRKTLSVLFVAIVLVAIFISLPSMMVKASSFSDDSAIVTTDMIEQINEALSYIEMDKESFGLSDIRFETLSVSFAIPIYVYKNNDFVADGELYPIKSNGDVVALAACVSDGKYVIDTALAKLIAQYDYSDIAIIYDSDSVYLYNGNNLIFLHKSGMTSPDRDELPVIERLSCLDIETRNISDEMSLEYGNYEKSQNRSYYSCNVSYVTQLPYENLCWAATIACISNYLYNTSLTAPAVSNAYFGTNTNPAPDYTLAGGYAASFMNSYYGIPYTYGSSRPSDNAILSNISAGYPIYGIFQCPSSLHAVTIYGIDPISGYISIKDPQFGSATGYSNGTTYTYYSTYAHNYPTLQSGICLVW